MFSCVEYHNRPDRLICLLLGCLLVSLDCFSEEGASSGGSASVRGLIDHAETYYWIGMAERGNMDAFRNGQDYLNKATVALAESDIEKAEKQNIYRVVRGLREDLREQAEVAHDTLHGVFPVLIAGEVIPVFNGFEFNTFELFDDPSVMAVTDSARKLRNAIIAKRTFRPQFDVVFTSAPRRPDLENEALYVFNGSSAFFVHNAREIAQVLPKELETQYREGNLSKDVQLTLQKALGADRFLQVHVEEKDVVDGINFYVLQGRVLNPELKKPELMFSVMGFSRDRRESMVLAALFAGALVFFGVIVFRVKSSDQLGPADHLIPLAGCVLGFILPIGLWTIFQPIKPAPETLAVVSFWWPVLAGVGFFLVPLLLWRTALGQLRRILQYPGLRNVGWEGFLAVTLGVCGHLCFPLTAMLGYRAGFFVIPLVIASGTATWLLARSLENTDRLPRHAVASSIFVFALTVFFLFSLNLVLLAAGAVMAVVIASAYAWWIDRNIEQRVVETYVTPENSTLTSGLANYGSSPLPFVETDTFTATIAQLPQPDKPSATWMLLTGKHGIGKTATADAVIRHLRGGEEARGFSLTRLFGNCRPDLQESDAFLPFRLALRKVLNSSALTSENRVSDAFDSVLVGLVDNLVPFANLFLPSEENQSGGRPTEIYDSVTRTLRKLSKHHLTILMIDDAQWIDDASKALLEHVFSAIPPGAPYRFLCIVCSATEENFETSPLRQVMLSLPEPDEVLQRRILTESRGIALETAEVLINNAAIGDREYSALYWLSRAISYLDQKKMLSPTREGKTLQPEQMKSVAREFHDMRRYILSKIPESDSGRRLIFMAAALGSVFEVNPLSLALDVTRLELLQQLRLMAEEDGLVKESCQTEDAYEFVSFQVWRYICDDLKIDQTLTGRPEIAMLEREYHARLAKALLVQNGRIEGSLGRAAIHYFVAGSAYANEAVDLCLEAAIREASRFNFGGAEQLLARAGKRASVIGRRAEVEWQTIKIESQKVHLFGGYQDREKMALRLLVYMRERKNQHSEGRLLAIRALYDAGNFKAVVRVAKDLLSDDPTDVRVRAESLQFLGLAEHKLSSQGAVRHLRDALKMLELEPSVNVRSQALLARVADALAGVLVHGEPAQREEASRFYRISLRIKERSEIQDLRGQAMTHGGLGRLALFSKPPNYAKARHHFEKDLEIAEEVQDTHGQSVMNSLLGDCYLAQDSIQQANNHYRRALELAGDDGRNRLFATVGMIRVAEASEDRELAEQMGESLLGLVNVVRLTSQEAKGIVEKLSFFESVAVARWFAELMRVLDDVVKTSNQTAIVRPISYRFVPIGSTAPLILPDDELWLDVGNRVGERVIDHHLNTQEGESSTQIVDGRGHDLIVKPLVDAENITIVLHHRPDIDAICAAWLVQGLLSQGQMPISRMSINQIVRAVTRHDQGYADRRPFEQQWPSMFNLRLMDGRDDEQRVKIGFKLLERTAEELERAELLGDIAVKMSTPVIGERLSRAQRMYSEDIRRAKVFSISLPKSQEKSEGSVSDLKGLQQGTNERQVVDAVLLKDLSSPLGCELARADTENAPHGDGFALVITSRTTDELDGIIRFRHIISVHPSSGVCLLGLGEMLERREQEKENACGLPLAAGREPVVQGQGRHGFNVASPWYDGRGHHFTIIDSPSIEIDGKPLLASLLTPEEVLNVIMEFGTTRDRRVEAA